MPLVQKELQNAYIGEWVDVTSLTLDKSSISLTTIGQTEQITATTVPAGATVNWSSSDTTVATVVNGLVTCVTPGTCTITAESFGVTATCGVTGGGWQPGVNTIAYYPLTSNANDYSGNGYNATNNGGTFSEENGGYFGDAYSRIDLPSMNIGQTFTVSGWVKLPNGQPTGNQGFQIYYDWSGSHRNLLFGALASGIRCLNGNNSSSSNSKMISVTFGTGWNNIVLSKSGTSFSVYMNGTLLETFTGYDVSIPGGYNTVQIPHDAASTSEYTAPGYLKDLVIENKARTAQEIADYYNHTKGNYGL